MRCLRQVCVCLVILAAGMPAVSAQPDRQEAEDAFTAAVKAYHQARYDDAVALNEAVLAKGFVSSAVYYNLGNAWFKTGRTGKSVVNYLRARRLAPRDSDLRANLSFARSMVENYVPRQSASLFVPAESFFADVELQWLALGALGLTGIFLLGGLYAGMPRKRIVLGTMLLALMTGYFSGAALGQAMDRLGAAVCVGKAEARFEPNLQGTVYFRVPDGTEVRILREKDGWVKIERPDGKAGWVPGVSVERI